MSKRSLYDADGIDGPFERGMNDAKEIDRAHRADPRPPGVEVMTERMTPAQLEIASIGASNEVDQLVAEIKARWAERAELRDTLAEVTRDWRELRRSKERVEENYEKYLGLSLSLRGKNKDLQAEREQDRALLNEALQRLIIEGYGTGGDALVQAIRERLEAE